MIALSASELHAVAEELSRLQHTTQVSEAVIGTQHGGVWCGYDEAGDLCMVWEEL